MALFAHNWRSITSDPWLLDAIQHYHIEFDSFPVQTFVPKEIKFSPLEIIIIGLEIDKLLHKRAIEPCLHEKGEFISTIFITPKKDGSFRPVINLKSLNEFVTYHHFKMETFQSALLLVEPTCHFACIDLKDAYFSIPIATEHRKFLRFQWKGSLYQFCVLPFGLSSAPRVFTKVLKPPIATLRNLGYVSCNYIDDALLIARDHDDCFENVEKRIQLFESLGFVINRDKSVCNPCTRIEFLGFVIDSVTMRISLPDRKRGTIASACRALANQPEAEIRIVSRVIGLMLAAEIAVPYGAIFRRDLEIEKNLALRCNGDNYGDNMSLSVNAQYALHWWAVNVCNSSSPIHRSVSFELVTDASLEGWGAYRPANKSNTQGQWGQRERNLHINALELLAVLFALQSLCSHESNVHIRIKSDNTSAVSCINRFGTCHSPDLHSLAREIWLWCCKRNVWLSAQHIPGVENDVADGYSRIFNTSTEWMLTAHVFKTLTDLFFMPDVDLFASRLNRRLTPFVSWRPDPDAMATDAFCLDWGRYRSYIFPPFCLLGRVLQKISSDKAEAIVIFPLWNTQAWYPKLLSMLVDTPIILPPVNIILSLPSSHREHPLARQLILAACHLSGNVYETEGFRNKLPALSLNRGDPLHRGATTQPSGNGYVSVLGGKLIIFAQM